jgi:MraZ protein
MLRGNATATLDEKGRVAIPAAFKKAFEQAGGNEVFVTSTDDNNIQIYLLATWCELVDNLYKEKKDDPLLRQFLMKTNYNGQKAGIDKYGRIHIPSFLRKKIKLEGKINIEGREDYLKLMPARM